jgi:hypothetical protein
LRIANTAAWVKAFRNVDGVHSTTLDKVIGQLHWKLQRFSESW